MKKLLRAVGVCMCMLSLTTCYLYLQAIRLQDIELESMQAKVGAMVNREYIEKWFTDKWVD